MGLDYVLREQSAHERLIAHVLAGSDTGKMYFCRFVTKTIYKALLALQHQLSVFTRQDKVGNVNQYGNHQKFRMAKLQSIEEKDFAALTETLDGDFLQTYLELAPRDQELIAEQALHETKAGQDAF